MQQMMKFGNSICFAVVLGAAVQSAWSADDAAIRQLVEQARYWQQNAREDLAAGAWQKLLRADANHPEALVRLGLIEARAGHLAQAEELYRHAAQLPAPPAGLADLETALRAGKNAPAIDTARKLAQSGQPQAAASSYRSALGTGKPTGQLGLEYYQTLGATPQGWEEARRGLEELARGNPGNQRYQLALARHLSYRESARRQGIRQLAVLSRQEQVGQEARNGWRQALEWLDARRADRALFSAYLARYPEDQVIRDRLARLDQALAASKKDTRKSPSQTAFQLLEQGQIEAAQKRFQAVLAKKPRNADALGGLGTIRLRQQAFDEALGLLEQAMQADRRHAARWQTARDSARYWTLLQPVLQARQAGKLLEVEDKLLEATRLDDKQILGQVLLGDLWAAKLQYSKAEAQYRSVLKSSSLDAGAFRGLISVLMQTGREREALSMLSSIDEAAALKLGAVNQLKAEAMLKLAEVDERAAAYQAALEKLEAAVLLDPANPWVRLALARQYQRLGDFDRANALLDALLKTRPESVEVLHARALLYAEQKLWQEGLNTLERIPVAARSGKIIEDQRRLSVNVQVLRALQWFTQGHRRQAEAAIAQAELEATSDSALLALVAGAWSKVGQPAEAGRLMREALARAPTDNIDLRLQYAGMLLDAGQDGELAGALQALAESRRLTASQQEDLNKIILAFTLRQTDTLRQAGRLTEAYRLVNRALQQSDDPRLLMALARIHNTAGEPQKALALAEKVIVREPKELDHRLFASAVALTANAQDRAAAHAQAALSIAPNDARALLAAGRAEKERGNLDQSLAYFQKAQAAQSAKTAEPVFRDQPVLTGFNPDVAGGGVRSRESVDGFSMELSQTRSGLLPIPPVRDAVSYTALMQPAAPLALAQGQERERTVGEEINAIKLKLSSTIELGTLLRARSGEAGLGRLSEAQIPVELALPIGGDGAFTLRLTPTLLSAGALSRTDPLSTARFGSYALASLPGNLDSGPQQDASGVAASVAYRDENLTLNIGTTPLGFLVNHLVGELKFTTKLDGLTLRGALSRGAVTDSVLSYAGTRDPRSQQVWGGVVKTGGQFGVTYGDDAGGIYLDVGGAALNGIRVKDNREAEASLGAYWRVYQAVDSKLKLGLNFTTLAYRDNLGYFTLGHGGYFSPQQYFSLGVPWELAGRRRSFSYQMGGEFSLQKFSQDRAPYFPNDPNLQNAWKTIAGASYPTYYEAESSSGLGYNLYGLFEYQLTPKLAVGGRLGFDNSRNYAQQSGLFYMRYAFDGLAQALPFSPGAPTAHVP